MKDEKLERLEKALVAAKKELEDYKKEMVK
jgi:hypothetical protein